MTQGEVEVGRKEKQQFLTITIAMNTIKIKKKTKRNKMHNELNVFGFSRNHSALHYFFFYFM